MYAVIFTTAGSKWALTVVSPTPKQAIETAIRDIEVDGRSYESVEAVLIVN